MKLHEKEREGWIYEVAQSWLETGHCCDVTVTCYDQDGVKSQFRCHKVLILPLLTQHCPHNLIEEAEQVLLPDVTPAEFRHFLSLAYGLQDASKVQGAIAGLLNGVKIKVEDDYCFDEDLEDLDESDLVGHTEDDHVKIPLLPDCKEEALSKEDVKQNLNDPDFVTGTKKKTQNSPRKIHNITCQECDKLFGRLDHFRKHMRRVHPGVDYEVPTSTKRSPGVQNKDYRCDHCGKVFKKGDHLKRHINGVHLGIKRGKDSSKEIKQCEMCGLKLRKDKLKAHMINRHTAFSCSCGVEVKNESLFYEHKAEATEGEHSLIVENNVEWFKPEPKPKPSKKLKITKVKPKVEKIVTYIPCDMCHEASKTPRELKEHKLEAHYTELKEKNMLYTEHGRVCIKIHSCDYDDCDKYFEDLRRKRDHIARDHLNLKQYVCNECGKGFTVVYLLKRHTDMYHPTPGEDHMCTHCGDRFPNSTLMRNHITAKHTAKKYDKLCKYCDYKTYNSRQLTEHERSHTGEMPEVCKICSQAFRHKKSLWTHMKLRHPSEKEESVSKPSLWQNI